MDMFCRPSSCPRIHGEVATAGSFYANEHSMGAEKNLQKESILTILVFSLPILSSFLAVVTSFPYQSGRTTFPPWLIQAHTSKTIQSQDHPTPLLIQPAPSQPHHSSTETSNSHSTPSDPHPSPAYTQTAPDSTPPHYTAPASSPRPCPRSSYPRSFHRT
jgi:hypothetical protein